ncbi:hypothetical protein L0337_40375 [candidate division KSB1 bacterium]|nr:hypothetical protein [candidate division KSB1 bacterium]
MREDIINPDFPAEHTGENRDEPSLSPPAAGKEHTETHSTFLPSSGEHAGAPLDHWEQEKAKLSLALTERLLRGRDTIGFPELMASPLLHHERLAGLGEIVVAVLRRHAREIIRQEKPLVLQSKRRFELDDAEIRVPLRELRDLIAERMVFDKNELHAALSFGLRLQFDMITKPAATLEKLIYQHAVTRDKDDVIVILPGLEENHSFVAHLQKLLAKHLDHSIIKETFVALCRRVEKEIYGRRGVSALVADLQTYQNFCAIIGPSSYHRLEAPTVLEMLHERGMEELAERTMPDLVQQARWSIPEIEHLLEERMSVMELPPAPPETLEPAIAPEVEFGRLLQESTSAMESPDAQQTDGQEKSGIAAEIKEQAWPQDEAQIDLDLTPAEIPEELDMPEAEIPSNGKESAMEPATLARDTDIEEEPAVLPATSGLSDIAVEPSLEIDAAPIPPRPKLKYYYADDDEPQIIERAKIEAQPPGPYPSFTRLVDEKSRRDFIKKIFHKDLEAYLAFIERLETMQTWKEAKAYLDHEFQQRRVNPYSREAVRLSDTVFSRYFTKGAR